MHFASYGSLINSFHYTVHFTLPLSPLSALVEGEEQASPVPQSEAVNAADKTADINTLKDVLQLQVGHIT